MEQFSDKRIDPHPIRLLTIYRSFNSSKKEDGLKQNPSLVCFSMQVVLLHQLGFAIYCLIPGSEL